MLSFLKWLVTTFGFLALLLFGLFNWSETRLVLNPFGSALQAPLALVVLGAIVFGFLWGALIVWIHDGRLRRENRKLLRDLRTVERHTTSLSPPQAFPAQS